MTHSAIAWALTRPFLPGPKVLLAVLGAQLPDLLTRVPGLFLDHAEARVLLPLHTPLGAALACLLAAELFAPCERRSARLWLLFGAATHLLADATQENVRGSYHWLFPFSTWNGQLAWWPIEAAVPTVPLQVLLIAAAELLLARRRCATIRPLHGTDRNPNPH